MAQCQDRPAQHRDVLAGVGVEEHGVGGLTSDEATLGQLQGLTRLDEVTQGGLGPILDLGRSSN